jgi:hypothetical protein
MTGDELTRCSRREHHARTTMRFNVAPSLVASVIFVNNRSSNLHGRRSASERSPAIRGNC